MTTTAETRNPAPVPAAAPVPPVVRVGPAAPTAPAAQPSLNGDRYADVGGRSTDRQLEEHVAANEGAYLDALLGNTDGLIDAAEEIRTHYKVIRVQRDGRDRYAFRVRGLDDEERDEAQREFTAFERVRGGMNLPDFAKSRMAYQRAHVVYRATHPEDAARLWDNERAQDRVLKGEKDLNRRRRAVTLIVRSLYADEIDEVIKVIDGFAVGGVAPQELAGKS